MNRIFAFSLAALLVTSCGGSDPETGAQPASQGGLYLITAEQLSNLTVRNAYDAIQRLHPSWLRRDPLVVLDGVTMGGGTQVLRSSVTANIAEIRYLTPNDGRIRYGGRGENGVILVTTKR